MFYYILIWLELILSELIIGSLMSPALLLAELSWRCKLYPNFSIFSLLLLAEFPSL